MNPCRGWRVGLAVLVSLSGVQSRAGEAAQDTIELSGQAPGKTEETPPPPPPRYTFVVNGVASDANDRDLRMRLIYRRSSRLTWEFTAGHAQIGTTPVFKFPYGSVGLRYGGPRTFFFINLGHWGDTELVSSLDLDLGVGLNTARWNWQIGFQYRQIDTEPIGLTGEQIPGADGSAQGRTLFAQLRFQATPVFAAYMSARDSTYAIPTEALAELFAQRLLDARSVTLISQFPDWTYSVGMDFAFGPERLNIDYTVIQTVFRGLRPEIFSAAVTLPAGKQKRLVFRVGQRDTANFSKVYFAALAFSTSF